VAAELEPRLSAARAGQAHVFFVDAAHFVLGTFLCCLWSFTRCFVRAASGRQRYNVLGAWNAACNQLVAVTNTTYITAETVCQLMRQIAALGLVGPITLVMDNARYQRCALVQNLAAELRIELLFLPSYSPNLNLIERLWKHIKKQCLYGRHFDSFATFRDSIDQCLAQLPQQAAALQTLMSHKFQTFDHVSFLTA
jgi:transposase